MKIDTHKRMGDTWHYKDGMISSDSDPTGKTIATTDNESVGILIAKTPEFFNHLVRFHEIMKSAMNWPDTTSERTALSNLACEVFNTFYEINQGK